MLVLGEPSSVESGGAGLTSTGEPKAVPLSWDRSGSLVWRRDVWRKDKRTSWSRGEAARTKETREGSFSWVRLHAGLCVESVEKLIWWVAPFSVLWVCLGIANSKMVSFWTVFAGLSKHCVHYGGGVERDSEYTWNLEVRAKQTHTDSTLWALQRAIKLENKIHIAWKQWKWSPAFKSTDSFPDPSSHNVS